MHNNFRHSKVYVKEWSLTDRKLCFIWAKCGIYYVCCVELHFELCFTVEHLKHKQIFSL